MFGQDDIVKRLRSYTRSLIPVMVVVAAILGACGAPPILPPMPASINVPDIWYGVSTSAYQNEDPAVAPGDPGFFKTDWELFAQAGGLKEAKGDGTWSYSEVQRDIDALKWLGVTHYRFGIEWARIEPEIGEYNMAAVAHYVAEAQALREAGIEPIVCLWHWTFPQWLADLDDPGHYGWLNDTAAERWQAYVRLMIEQLAPHVRYYAPMNEPDIQATAGFLAGLFPPGTAFAFDLHAQNIDAATTRFFEAVHIIRETYPAYAGADAPDVQILSIHAMNAWTRDPLDLFGWGYDFAKQNDFDYLDRVQEKVDIIGFTYYTQRPAFVFQPLPIGPGFSDTGAPIGPDGLTDVIVELSERYGKPLLILENGIADASELRRPIYLVTHVAAVQAAAEMGYPVLGYMHWSLVDNFEWHNGYASKFGLFSLDRETREIVPKESAYIYRDIIRAKGGEYRPDDTIVPN